MFESGVVQVYELERYIRDDVERYGVRLKELEKKLVGAYRDVVSIACLPIRRKTDFLYKK